MSVKFPKTILVTKEQDSDTEWLSASETLDELDSERAADSEVGIYELVEVSRFKVERTLVPVVKRKK